MFQNCTAGDLQVMDSRPDSETLFSRAERHAASFLGIGNSRVFFMDEQESESKGAIMAIRLCERAVEQSTGQSVEFIRNTPIDELRRLEEEKRGHPLVFVSAFPWIGRGSVLRDRLITREEVDAQYENAIQELPGSP